MQTPSLSLRQQKLLKLIQNAPSHITGAQLAKQLGVSPRTIRNDILEINQNLLPLNAQICSEKSKGYFFRSEDPKVLTAIYKNDITFLTKEDRVRYLAFQLCLSDIPINLYDLEEEMAISHTTLQNDLHLLKMHYVHAIPHIRIHQQKDYIEFEKDERKRRTILNRLFYVDWDYDGRSNAYYGYHFLDSEILTLIMNEIPLHLERYHIRMEDTNLVSLNLAVAIMYHRITSGHNLPGAAPIPKPDTAAMYATRDLLDALEQKLHCAIQSEERDDIYQNIASGHLLDADQLNFQTVPKYFGPITIEMADHYLKRIVEMFGLDFFNDEDFYVTLLQYIRSLQLPFLSLNTQGNMDIAKEHLMIEFELAYLFQETSLRYMGYYIDQAELIYLAYCLSGALEYFCHHHPEYKLKTIICSQLNLSAIWGLKRRVLGAFANYIDVTGLLPVNQKSAYDFSNTDLVLATVRKTITDSPGTDTLRISPFLDPSDIRQIEAYIKKKRIQRFSQSGKSCFLQLLQDAYWHENQEIRSYFSIIEHMALDFIQDGLANSDFTEDILRREAISSFAFCPGVLFLHSLVQATKTRLSIMVLKHRIVWNGHKIRLIFMASFAPADATLLFELLYRLYGDHYEEDALMALKTKQAVLDYYNSDIIPFSSARS